MKYIVYKTNKDLILDCISSSLSDDEVLDLAIKKSKNENFIEIEPNKKFKIFNHKEDLEGSSLYSGRYLETLKEKKLLELEAFHYHPNNRKVDALGHYIYNTKEFRALIQEQIFRLERKISKGDITLEQAIFNYKYNGSGNISLPLSVLENILIKLQDLADENYQIKQGHRDSILSLDTKDKVNNYDFTIGYKINQTITI